MSPAAEKEHQHISESHGCADRDHDLVHELSRRLDALWRYDQYVANAEGCPDIQALWYDLKRQCQADIHRLKQLIAAKIEKGCF